MSPSRPVAGRAASLTRRNRWGRLLPASLLLAFAAVGCEDRNAERARQEAVTARAEAERLKFNLQKARQEIDDLEAELTAVRESRDALEDRVAQLIQERDDALSYAAEAEDAVADLTSQARGRANTAASLEQEVTQLRALVEDQQELIEELQKGEPAGPAGQDLPPASDVELPADPNQTF